jgi:hypothetical protein
MFDIKRKKTRKAKGAEQMARQLHYLEMLKEIKEEV